MKLEDLIIQIKNKNSFLCVGLDTDIDKIPKISVIENTRFCIGEKSNDIDLSKRLAGLGDLIVMDAFATSHRAHASTAGVITFSNDACAGLLLDEELKNGKNRENSTS